VEKFIVISLRKVLPPGQNAKTMRSIVVSFRVAEGCLGIAGSTLIIAAPHVN